MPRLLVALLVVVVSALAMFDRLRPFGPPPPPQGDYAVDDGELLLPAASGRTRAHVWRPRLATTHVPSAVSQPHPIVLFAPGWLGHAADNALILADLASRGYIVVGFDDVAHDPAPPDETPEQHADRVAILDLSSDATFERGRRSAEIRTELEVAKARSVLDGIEALLRARSPIFRDADPTRIGSLGFSFGGWVGVELASRDPRIGAVANLDGRWFGAGAESGPARPYLLLSSMQYLHDPSDFTAPEPPRRITAEWSQTNIDTHAKWLRRSDVYWFEVGDSLHEDFMDVFFRPHWRAALRRGWRRRVTERTAINHLIGAFFDIYLRGSPATSLRDAPPPEGTRRVVSPPRVR